MAHVKNHDYHVLPPSVWPFIGSVTVFIMLFGAVLWMHESGPWLFLIGLVGVLYTMFAWWADTVAESQAGDHTPVVIIGLRYGFIFFIMSEVMFFAAWFWSSSNTRCTPWAQCLLRLTVFGRQQGLRHSTRGTCRLSTR